MKVEVIKTEPTPPPVKIVIECTYREAQYLRELLQSTLYRPDSVSSHPTNAPTEFCRKLYDHLGSGPAGIRLAFPNGGDYFFTGRVTASGEY